jgi:uncharacterized protein with PQ loop repeat
MTRKIVGELLYSITSIMFMVTILPQVTKIFITKSAKDLSMNAFVMRLFTNFLLISSGMLLNIRTMVIAGSIYVVLNSTQITLKAIYDKRQKIKKIT